MLFHNPQCFGYFKLILSLLNLKAAVLKGYPSEITLVSFYCLFGTIQSALVTLIFERDPNAWMLSPDIELISVVYSALFGNVVTFGVQAWCIRRKGPVFVATFKPLSIAIAAFLGFIFLGETLYIGSKPFMNISKGSPIN
ncbi:WAT1-related protein [Gossypium australe]|uniref:WAT1-related protein n=1 Tax=Gossypium australe TaxID=47621 RepID=A0A5B6UDN2_9ROSI|nr:WAT1-related protein [Gossypium australe]